MWFFIWKNFLKIVFWFLGLILFFVFEILILINWLEEFLDCKCSFVGWGGGGEIIYFFCFICLIFILDFNR